MRTGNAAKACRFLLPPLGGAPACGRGRSRAGGSLRRTVRPFRGRASLTACSPSFPEESCENDLFPVLREAGSYPPGVFGTDDEGSDLSRPPRRTIRGPCRQLVLSAGCCPVRRTGRPIGSAGGRGNGAGPCALCADRRAARGSNDTGSSRRSFLAFPTRLRSVSTPHFSPCAIFCLRTADDTSLFPLSAPLRHGLGHAFRSPPAADRTPLRGPGRSFDDAETQSPRPRQGGTKRSISLCRILSLSLSAVLTFRRSALSFRTKGKGLSDKSFQPSGNCPFGKTAEWPDE